MYQDFLMEIRKRPSDIEDMPNRAQDVLRCFGVNYLSNGVPIVEILASLGFKIYQSNLEPNGLSAYIVVDPQLNAVFQSNKIICVHIQDSIGHKKFALAHELCHYIFDFNEDKDIHYYDTYFPRKNENEMQEKRANKFAANLLMPEKEFRKKVKEYRKIESKVNIISLLEEYFVVSTTAIIRRLQELGISGYDNMET